MDEFTWTCPVCNEVLATDSWERLGLMLTTHKEKHETGQAAAVPWLKDVVPEEVLKGNLVTMDEVIEKVILVKDFSLKDSTFKEDTFYLSLVIEVDGEERILNTGAERIVQAFKQVDKGKLPVYVTFEKVMSSGGRRVYRIKL